MTCSTAWATDARHRHGDYFYSAAHPSAKNKAFVDGVQAGQQRHAGEFHLGVAGYDGMHLIYEALKKTGGKTDGESLINAVKGMAGKARAGR